ncbi:MAG TPA: PRC-barrel domain-containing protein, partial [Ktedonobacterales bacterium]|nr:PRC-barrel domain-containing protein [Ktedonobacterales bacterium]
MRASELKGRAIVTLSNAEQVGRVDDVLFDTQYRQVLGFRVRKGLLSHSEAVLREAVSAIGNDAITVPSPDALNEEKRFPELQRAASLEQVHNTKVVTEGGRMLGTVGDLEVDNDAHSVIAYTLAVPLLDRLRHHESSISAHDVLQIGGGGIMTVKNSVADSLQAT